MCLHLIAIAIRDGNVVAIAVCARVVLRLVGWRGLLLLGEKPHLGRPVLVASLAVFSGKESQCVFKTLAAPVAYKESICS